VATTIDAESCLQLQVDRLELREVNAVFTASAAAAASVVHLSGNGKPESLRFATISGVWFASSCQSRHANSV